MEQSSPGTVTDSGVIANALNRQSNNIVEAAEQRFDDLSKEAESNESTESKEELAEEIAEQESKKETEIVESESNTDEEPAGEGYYADEDITEVENKDLQTPQGQTQMGAWILENLPSISITGTSNGRPVTLQVKRAEDLPIDFEFSNKRDEKIFDQSIADQTTRAYRLAEYYQQQQNEAQSKQYNDQENRDIQTDIAALQRQGELPKFKYEPTDPRFNDDPAVKEMQAILEYYNTENQNRFREAQENNRLFHHLSYRDAYRLYRIDNPKTGARQKAEDTARKSISRTTAGAGRGTAAATSRPKLPRNASIDQIISAYGVE